MGGGGGRGTTWKPRKFGRDHSQCKFNFSMQSDNLRSFQNFENLSITKSFGSRATVFCSIHKNKIL